jgi:hypothetical protein
VTNKERADLHEFYRLQLAGFEYSYEGLLDHAAALRVNLNEAESNRSKWQAITAFAILLVIAFGLATIKGQTAQSPIADADDCMEWAAKSEMSKFLDGPNTAKYCQDYFAGRSDSAAKDDLARWENRISSIRQEWDKWRDAERSRAAGK